MEETISTSTNIPRIEPPLGNFSQICTVLLTNLAATYNQPVLVLITTILMALNALIPAASPYRLLYQYVLVPQGWLKPRSVEKGKLTPYRFSRISTVLLLVSTILLFFTPALAFNWEWWLGWMLDVMVGLLMMADLVVRLFAWMARNYSSPPSDWESPMIPKRTIAVLYVLGLGLMIADLLLDLHSPYTMTARPPILIGIILYMLAWLGALTNAIKARSCLWFLSQIFFTFSPLMLPIFVFFGPGPTQTVSNTLPKE